MIVPYKVWSQTMPKTKQEIFTFVEVSNSYSKEWEVGCNYDANDKQTKEPINIGKICIYPSSKDKLSIVRVGPDRWTERWSTPKLGAKFADKEAAAWALLVIYQSIQDNPLPSEVRSFLDRRGEHLRKEKDDTLGRIYAIQREQAELQHMANKHGLEFDFGVDMKKEVSDLKNFMAENNDALYEHLGKDFARSLRVYVKSVVKLVDAEAAEEI